MVSGLHNTPALFVWRGVAATTTCNGRALASPPSCFPNLLHTRHTGNPNPTRHHSLFCATTATLYLPTRRLINTHQHRTMTQNSCQFSFSLRRDGESMEITVAGHIFDVDRFEREITTLPRLYSYPDKFSGLPAARRCSPPPTNKVSSTNPKSPRSPREPFVHGSVLCRQGRPLPREDPTTPPPPPFKQVPSQQSPLPVVPHHPPSPPCGFEPAAAARQRQPVRPAERHPPALHGNLFSIPGSDHVSRHRVPSLHLPCPSHLLREFG